MRATLLVVAMLGVLLASTGRGAGAADRPAVILYTSDWLGPMRILVADPREAGMSVS